MAVGQVESVSNLSFFFKVIGYRVMANFTPTQGRYLAFIHAYTEFHGYPPAESDIAAALLVSAPSVTRWSRRSKRKG